MAGNDWLYKKDEKNFLELSKEMTILRSFNMSIGINLLKNLVKISSKKIGKISDIEILKFTIIKKKDVPSGTALSIYEAVNEGLGYKENLFLRKVIRQTKKKMKLDFHQ